MRTRLHVTGRPSDRERLAAGIVPPTVAAALDGTVELSVHKTLRERRAELVQERDRLQEALGKAREADALAEREAARQTTKRGGSRWPKQKAPAIEEELEAASERLEAIDRELASASSELLAAARHVAENVLPSVQERTEGMNAEVESLFAQLLDAAQRQAQLDAELAWCDSLAWEGSASPWSLPAGAGPLWATQELTRALAAFRASRESVADYRREVAETREREFDGPGQPKVLRPAEARTQPPPMVTADGRRVTEREEGEPGP